MKLPSPSLPSLLIALCLYFPLQHRACAQGNDNPTGIAGEHNGSVTTAGQYDPYTGNGRRVIDDLTVSGAVGAYPLKWSRLLTTRRGNGYGVFGQGGSWANPYEWGIVLQPDESPPIHQEITTVPYDLAVVYPDGRYIEFFGGPNLYRDNSGAGQRVRRNTATSYDLLLEDGGEVQFRQIPVTDSAGVTTYSLGATAVLDPYKQKTTLNHDLQGRLFKITEPGGRSLQIRFDPYPAPGWAGGGTFYFIGSVSAYDGRGTLIETVRYSYTQLIDRDNHPKYTLTGASYDDGPSATYTYEQSNLLSMSSHLVHSCDDVRYAGPMKKIEYEYVQYPEAESWGQLKKEKNATTHQTVSEIIYPPRDPARLATDPAGWVRTEKRGDGPQRTFIIHGFLDRYTDFQNHSSFIDYDARFFRSRFTDARGKTTLTDREPLTGALLTLTHPGDNSTIKTNYSDPNNPYYVANRTDERSKTTYYDRDAKNRIWQIRYPDGGVELFTYNAFGQVLTHTLTSGGVENFRYDARGLKTLSWPPATASDPNPEDHPTKYFYYQSGPQTDRLRYVVDPRGNATWYEYNLRGQVTKLSHQDGTFVQSEYNPDGTLKWTADENHPGAATNPSVRTRYTYDEYKRVLTVTNPENETTTNNYALDWENPLVHTTASIKAISLPSGKNRVFAYDENFRKEYEVIAAATPDEMGTWFDYDEVGNLISTTDQQNNITRFGYDNRNRQTSIKDALGRTTQTQYDPTSNKLWVKRALGFPLETIVQYTEYDEMNRLKQQIDERGVLTRIAYDTAGNLLKSWDGNNNLYQYEYDYLNRRKSMTYPDTTTEAWTYDAAGKPPHPQEPRWSGADL